MNVIEAKRLGKHYGGAWALHECTLAIPAGYVAAPVGPNGAGKTTLLNLAVGLAAPSAGSGGAVWVNPPPRAAPQKGPSDPCRGPGRAGDPMTEGRETGQRRPQETSR